MAFRRCICTKGHEPPHLFLDDIVDRHEQPQCDEEVELGATSQGGYRIYEWMGRFSFQYIETHDGALTREDARLAVTRHRDAMRNAVGGGSLDPVIELLRWEAQQRKGVAPQAAEHFAFVAEFLAAQVSSPPVPRRFGAAKGSVVYESPDAWDPDDHPPDGYFARRDNYLCGQIHGAWVVQGTSFEDAVARCWAHKRSIEAGQGAPR